jgi:hypothetical protein
MNLIRRTLTLLVGLSISLFAMQGTALAQGKKDSKFMGLKVEGKRIVLLFDLSASVVFKAKGSGMPLQKIMEQTDALITSLPEDSEFALIQFVRNYKPFREALVPATKENREEARGWMEVEWNESGMMPRGPGVISPDPNGFPAVLRAAYEMNPDVIFVISDGSFERGKGSVNEEVTEKEFEALFEEMAAAGKKVPLNFVGFQMNRDDKSFWSKMTRKLGGDLREVR